MLKPFHKKLHVITDGEEKRAVHPLTPAVRSEWILEPFKASDIEPGVKIKTRTSKSESDVETKAENKMDDESQASDE